MHYKYVISFFIEYLHLSKNIISFTGIGFIPPHPDCVYCRKEDPIKVSIESEAFTFMKNKICEEPDKETGGILVGHKKNKGHIHVRFASGPGPNARRTKELFEKDIKFCQAFINEKYQKYGDKAIYVGEWHYHTNENNHPSNIDLLSLSKIAVQKEYLTEKPIMIIFSRKGKASCTVHPADKKFYYTDISIK